MWNVTFLDYFKLFGSYCVLVQKDPQGHLPKPKAELAFPSDEGPAAMMYQLETEKEKNVSQTHEFISHTG